MITFAQIKNIIWLILSSFICFGFLTEHKTPAAIASAAIFFAMVYWLMLQKNELREKLLAEEKFSTAEGLRFRKVGLSQPLLKDSGPPIALAGGLLIYIGHETSHGNISTRMLNLLYEIFGIYAIVIFLVFLGTFLLIRGCEIIIDGRANK